METMQTQGAGTIGQTGDAGQDRQGGLADTLHLWLPGLYGTGAAQTGPAQAVEGVYRLWPGLPRHLAKESLGEPWTPADLPCSRAEMGAFVAEIERFAKDALHGTSALGEAWLDGLRRQTEQQVLDEMAAIWALAGRDAGSEERAREQRRALARRRAQRTLAWIWFQQRTLADMEGLMGKVNAGLRSLGLDFGKGADDEVPVLPAGMGLDQSFGADDAGPACNWRVWLAAALVLVPKDTVFVLEGDLGLRLAEEAPEGQTDSSCTLALPAGLAAKSIVYRAGELLGAMATGLDKDLEVHLLFLEDKA